MQESVLDKQRARIKWQQQQQQQQQQTFYYNTHNNSTSSSSSSFVLPLVQHYCTAYVDDHKKNNHEILGALCNGCPDLATAAAQYPIPTSSCLGEEEDSPKDTSLLNGRGLKKIRKAGKSPIGKQVGREKRKKEEPDDMELLVETKLEIQQRNSINCINNNKREDLGENYSNSKASAPQQKTDYIHVRARRGQATDSHSLAERVRREKISERMKYLQDLVPGCNKIIGKASMLDEIINYVQSLQRQVEFLSMKLATLDSQIGFNMDSFLGKEINSTSSTSISKEMSSELVNPSHLQFMNPLQRPIASCHGLDVTMNLPDTALHRTISEPISVPDAFSDLFFDVHGSSAWDSSIQGLYNVEFHQGR